MADFVPWWQPAIIAACVVIGVLTLAAAGMFVYTGYFADKVKAKRNPVTVEEKREEEQ